jgi:hypothetical protein
MVNDESEFEVEDDDRDGGEEGASELIEVDCTGSVLDAVL